MRIDTSNPYGLTGSNTIDGLYVYISETEFTKDNLPEPYMNNTVSYSGYNIDFPEKDKPYWVMWAYRSRDNQKVYGPCVRLVDWSDKLTAIFNNNPGFYSGDANAGYLNSAVASTDRVNITAFDTAAGINTGWDNVSGLPYWFIFDGAIRGLTLLPNKNMVTASTLYRNGYLGKSGTLSDVYAVQTITLLGGPITQGRFATTPRVRYQTWVPTLDEFKLQIGVAYQTGIPTTVQPLSATTLQTGRWYLTSTESSTGKFWAINDAGLTKEVGHSESLAVYMMFSMTPL